jgi:two-component system, OmpR family, KDP operon response regulator KdpE
MAGILLVGIPHNIEMTIRRNFQPRGWIPWVASDATSALSTAAEVQPVLAIFNIEQADQAQSLGLCSTLREVPGCADLLLIIVSTQSHVLDKLEAFAAGADDYLTIPFHVPEFMLRVQALLRRSARYLRETQHAPNPGRRAIAGPAPAGPAPTGRRNQISLDERTGELSVLGQRILLTPIETRLLDYLLRAAGRPVSAEELLRHVWEQPPGTGDPALVRVCMHNLRGKLQHNPTLPPMLRTIPRLGYKLALEEAYS